MDKKTILKCGIFLLVILSVNLISAVITGSETMTRTPNITTVSPGQTFILSYNTIGTSGQWGAIVEDNVSGGCLFPSGTSVYRGVLLSDDGTSKQVQITAPNSVGTCIFTGNYNFGNESIKQFTTETVLIGNNSPSLIINSPLNGEIFSSRKVLINVIVNPKDTTLTKLEFTDYSESRRSWDTLCTNCKDYNKLESFDDGKHNLIFRGTMGDGQIITNGVNFSVDTKDPRISKTEPRSNKYTNGSNFYIKYTEANCQTLKILINGQEILSQNCTSGKNIEKITPLDISSFNGRSDVKYAFKITDIAGNIDESRDTKIKVDTTSPEITSLNYTTIGRYVYFNIKVNELNLDKVEYMDKSESRARWKTLCTSLKNGVCEKKVSFSRGNHNIVVRALDEAGNSAIQSLSFTI